MKLCWVRWKDAVAEEASLQATGTAKLATLEEVGWLLDENTEGVLIGMERNTEEDMEPGRWRLHIPKVAIVEMRVFEMPKTRRRKL